MYEEYAKKINKYNILPITRDVPSIITSSFISKTNKDIRVDEIMIKEKTNWDRHFTRFF